MLSAWSIQSAKEKEDSKKNQVEILGEKYRECGLTPGLSLNSSVCLKKKHLYYSLELPAELTASPPPPPTKHHFYYGKKQNNNKMTNNSYSDRFGYSAGIVSQKNEVSLRTKENTDNICCHWQK